MTRVNRPLRRETAATIRDGRSEQPIIITIEPPGKVIGFKVKGSRKTYTLPVDWCYRQAVLADVEATREARKAVRRK